MKTLLLLLIGIILSCALLGWAAMSDQPIDDYCQQWTVESKFFITDDKYIIFSQPMYTFEQCERMYEESLGK